MFTFLDLGVLAILATYFVGGNTFIPNDPSALSISDNK